jgi:hypothetical protein
VSGLGPVASYCECSNEPRFPLKATNFFE